MNSEKQIADRLNKAIFMLISQNQNLSYSIIPKMTERDGEVCDQRGLYVYAFKIRLTTD